MSDQSNKQTESREENGNYVVKKGRKSNIIAFILCFLVACIIWIYATNAERKDEAEAQSGNTLAVTEAVEGEASV